MKSSTMLFFMILGIFATFLICAGASLVGVTMSYARPWRQGNWDRDNNPTPKTSVVLVAREDMPAGTRLAFPETKFRVRLYRIGEQPSDAAMDYNAVRAMVLTRPLHKDEVCTLAHLQNPFQMVALPPGTRAFSFRPASAAELAGFLLPGTRVDVSGQAPFDQFGQGAIKVLAQDCLVLAVNVAQMDPGEPVDQGNSVTLTVAVTPDEMGALLAAMRQGQLTVTLRMIPKD